MLELIFVNLTESIKQRKKFLIRQLLQGKVGEEEIEVNLYEEVISSSFKVKLSGQAAN